MSDEEFLRNQREIFYDRKYDASLQAVAEATAQEAVASAGGMPDPMGAPGGDEMPLDGEAPEGTETEMPPDAAPDMDAPEPDTGDLLASPPGSRPSPRITPGAKGKKYYPVKSDKRDMGARSRSYKSLSTPEMGTYRSINHGASELRTLSKGIFTEEASNYSDTQDLQELRLFEINHEVRSLIENLQLQNKQESTENEDEA
jgi:hypothetical protein